MAIGHFGYIGSNATLCGIYYPPESHTDLAFFATQPDHKIRGLDLDCVDSGTCVVCSSLFEKSAIYKRQVRRWMRR